VSVSNLGMDAGNHSFSYAIYLQSCVNQVIPVWHRNYCQVEADSTCYFSVTSGKHSLHFAHLSCHALCFHFPGTWLDKMTRVPSNLSDFH
jgi:hypothetical protein